MIRANEYIRPMRGGSQAQLLSDDSGGQWVVKFLNNPQHPRVLANEWIASSLARAIGLTVPDFEIMDVSADTIEGNSAMGFHCGSRREERPMARSAWLAIQRQPGRNCASMSRKSAGRRRSGTVWGTMLRGESGDCLGMSKIRSHPLSQHSGKLVFGCGGRI
ncbi:MAG: HipA family kinase [Terriglobales bacterium]